MGGKKAARPCVVAPSSSQSSFIPAAPRGAEIESLRWGDFSGPRREEEEEEEGVFVREVGLDRGCGGVSYVRRRPRPGRRRQTDGDATRSVPIAGKSAANWPLRGSPPPASPLLRRGPPTE